MDEIRLTVLNAFFCQYLLSSRLSALQGLFFSSQAPKPLKPSSPREPVPASPLMSMQWGQLHPAVSPGPGEPWGCRDQSLFGEQRFSVLFLQQDHSALGGGVCCLKNAKVANGTWQKSALRNLPWRGC